MKVRLGEDDFGGFAQILLSFISDLCRQLILLIGSECPFKVRIAFGLLNCLVYMYAKTLFKFPQNRRAW